MTLGMPAIADPLKSEAFERERKKAEEKKEEEKQAEQAQKISPEELKQKVSDWAEKQFETLPNNIKKKMNTATVVYDEKTGKCYYGRNGAPYELGYVKNPKLFGENGILPKESLNGYRVGNCAEVDAVNQALNNGANLKDLHMTTIHTTKSSFGKGKEACENCTEAFKGKIKQNYTGWKGDKNE